MRLVVAERHSEHAAGGRQAGAGRAGWSDGLALALIVLLAVALNWRSVFKANTLPASGPGSDLWTTHWNNAAFLKEAVRQLHTFPLWNPHTMSGRPFAGDPLAAIFYPPMELVNLFSLRTFFLLILVAHLAFAGIGTYALARRGARLGVGAGIFAAIAFMWAPRMIGHFGAGHVTMVFAASWLPWVALGLVLAIRENAIWAAPTGLAFGLAILAGHPQVAFYHVLMIGAITLGGIVWAVAHAPSVAMRDRVLAGLRVVGIAAASGAIGALIATPLILPALEFTDASLRQSGLGVTDRIAFLSFIVDLFRVPLSAQTPHELTFAPGIAVLFLIPLAFYRRRWLAAGLSCGVLATIVIALGAETPVLPFLAAHVPGFSYFRAPARIWFLAALALAILAGLGFDALLRDRRSLRLFQPVLILLLAANLWLMDSPLLHALPIQNGYDPLKIEQAASKLAGGNRVYGVERNIRQSVTTELGLDLADGQDPLQIAGYARFIQLAGGYHYDTYAIAIPPYEVYDLNWPTHQEAQPNARILGLLNVGLVLSRHELTDPNLKQVGKEDNTFIYHNNAVLPRAFLVSDALGKELAGADMQQMASLAAEGQVVPDTSTGQAIVSGIGPNGLKVQVDARQAGYLIAGSPWYPGWEARIDGKRVDLVKVGGVLQGVAVPAGNHTVEIIYRPSSVTLGLILCLIGLLAAGAWTCWFVWRTRLARGSTAH